jgi:hypothetical protein
MSFTHLSDETPGERFLHVTLEANEQQWHEWRHCRATVVRAAVSHTKKEDGTVLNYYDEKNAIGYRNASWSKAGAGGLFVESMALRGQIDVGRVTPLAEGRPYANEVRFTPYDVRKDNAIAMAAFHTKYCAYQQKKYNEGCRNIYKDDFFTQLSYLAGFLKIKNFLFNKQNCNGFNLADANNFEGIDQVDLPAKLHELLGDFEQPAV